MRRGMAMERLRSTDSGTPLHVSWNDNLHIRIIRPAAAFRRHPGDVLVRILDVAGFAVDAILSVDHELRRAALLYPFIHARRAVARGRAGKDVVLGALLQV